MVKVKICGVRTVEAAQAIVDAGADFLGLNFVPTSKRKISTETAKKIADTVRNKIKIVGVFQNQPIEYIQSIIQEISLDMIQLHGNEDKEYMEKISLPIIKVKMDQSNDYMNASYVMVDRAVQGIGEMVDLEDAKKLAQKYKLFFAGGLTPETVETIVRTVKPFAVDVAGGIETNGEQDIEKIREFIENAKEILC